MDARDGRQDARMLLTQEEEASLPLLKPLFVYHLDHILETLAHDLVSDHEVASVQSDDLAVARLKRAQQAYLFSLLNGNNGHAVGGTGASSGEYRDPFGLGVGWHLRSFVHVLTALQPLVFEAFWTRPRLYRTVWNALLKVIFRDFELALRASLTQRGDGEEAAWQGMNEMKRTLDLAVNKEAVLERQRQAERRTLMSLFAGWRAKMSGVAQEMGTPLNVILVQAESLLERTGDEKTQAALRSILRQVERLIPLREQLCFLDHEPGRESPALDHSTMVDGRWDLIPESQEERRSDPR
jgi:signal transduction histidine kinase